VADRFFSDSCLAWPPEVQAALDYAVNLWEGYLNSAGPIDIEACWTSMANSYILGHGGGVYSYANFPNAPVSNTWYPSAMANALSGQDINDSY
jgi:hypothetical protein